MNCEHRQPDGICALGLFDWRPSPGTCKAFCTPEVRAGAKPGVMPPQKPPTTHAQWQAAVAEIHALNDQVWNDRLDAVEKFKPHGGCYDCKIGTLRRQLIQAWRARA